MKITRLKDLEEKIAQFLIVNNSLQKQDFQKSIDWIPLYFHEIKCHS